MEIAAKIFGIIGIAITVLIYQQQSRKSLLGYKLLSDMLWLLHYAMLGAYSGAAISVIAMIRELVFMNRERKWAKSPVWLGVFLSISVLSAVLTWKNAFSLLPMMASILAIVSFWIGIPKMTRIFSFPISVSMLIYDIFSGSVEGGINETLTIISSAYGCYRYDRMAAKK